MKKVKRLITATLVVMVLGSLAGCIVVDRDGGYRRHGDRYYDRDRNRDRR